MNTVFLDRDGTLIDTVRGPYYERSAYFKNEIYWLPHVLEECAALRVAGYDLVVVTNQPDVAAGYITEKAARNLTHIVASVIGAKDYYVCPHASGDYCRCRKPAPGLLLKHQQLMYDTGRTWKWDSCWIIGDRPTDVEAGVAAGIPPEHCLQTVGDDFAGAVDMILSNRRRYRETA